MGHEEHRGVAVAVDHKKERSRAPIFPLSGSGKEPGDETEAALDPLVSAFLFGSICQSRTGLSWSGLVGVD